MEEASQLSSSIPVILLGAGLISLDPHSALHTFVVLPLLAAAIVIGAGTIVWAIVRRWQGHAGDDTEPLDRGPSTSMRVRYGLVGFLVWIVLSTFLILDLAGSVSLYPLFPGVYAVGMVVVVLVLLHPRPTREKALIVVLLLPIFLSVGAVDWNSRKPFLRDLRRVEVGMTQAQVDQIMGGYWHEIGSLTQVSESGGLISGTLNYRHSSEDWGNSDIGVLTFEHGRVVYVRFLPD
jgi:hypothetical protein